jgi:two-component system phosphate regulon sensor histidine kinase PhoR
MQVFVGMERCRLGTCKRIVNNQPAWQHIVTCSVNFNKVKIIILAGAIAFVGIIVIQIYLLRQAFNYEEKKVSQTIQVALLEVSSAMNRYYGYPMTSANPVEKISRDYYVVNMRNDFDAKVLELLLTNHLAQKKININFEYAIYDCETDAMLYGNSVRMDSLPAAVQPKAHFPKASHLVYYFAVRFPGVNSFIYQSLRIWVILSVILLIALSIYIYAIYIILQQQRFANLQKDFINNMTHEFKTPLSSILIAANYLSKQDAIVAQDKLLTYSKIIIDQGNKLNEHLEKILSIAKSDSRPDILQFTVFDMRGAIQKTIEVVQLKYPEANIVTSLPDQPVWINADPFHFSNVVYNFLDNSIKYCAVKPQIKLQAKLKNDVVLLDIQDNGIGIPTRLQKQVFEKFYRVPDTEKSMVNGFGLGLFYVQKICNLHRWKLQLVSSVGVGTTIQVQIPFTVMPNENNVTS